jgi:hypothetical protein
MASQTTSNTQAGRGGLARFFARTLERIKRLFRKQSSDNPNIYPFF